MAAVDGVGAEIAADVPVEMAIDVGEEKQVKEKKSRRPRTPKEKKPKITTPAHPPYFEMIKDAILALNGKSGSSPYAIAKYMENNHKDVLPPNYKKVLAVQLRNFTTKGKLIKVKASFKLAEAAKDDEIQSKKNNKHNKKAVKEQKPIEAPKRAKRSSNRMSKKAAQPKPKQPKSIKFPASKKAAAATAKATA